MIDKEGKTSSSQKRINFNGDLWLWLIQKCQAIKNSCAEETSREGEAMERLRCLKEEKLYQIIRFKKASHFRVSKDLAVVCHVPNSD